MATGVFITGTDTGVGKTWFTIALMEELKKQGLNIAGMKPVASGAALINDKLINEDANLIQAHCSATIDYELINPYVFEPPVAPHIAAEKSNQHVNIDRIIQCYSSLLANSDLVVVEGVGGWRVPLSGRIATVDLVKALALPVILVVGIRLGCINHALLTEQSILSDQIELLGWVSNHVDEECLVKPEIIETLRSSLTSQHLGDLPHAIDPVKGFCRQNTDLLSLLRI